MKRRDMLSTLGAGMAGIATLSGSSAIAAQQSAAPHHRDKIHEDCLNACSDCARRCDETFHHCYVQVAEGKRDHAKSLHLVSDCAGFCNLSASLIAKHSPLMAYSCSACAAACAATATEVEKFDSPEMRVAAQSLRKCERSCKDMVKAMGGHDHGHDSPPK